METKKFIQLASKFGFFLARHSDGHSILKNNRGKHVAIPAGKKEIQKFMAQRLVREMASA